MLKEIDPKRSWKAPFMLAGATYFPAELFASIIKKVPLPHSSLIATGIKWGAPGVVFLKKFWKSKLYEKISSAVKQPFNYINRQFAKPPEKPNDDPNECEDRCSIVEMPYNGEIVDISQLEGTFGPIY